MDKLNIRLITKNDELSNWETSTLPLHKGELVLAKINVMQPDGTSAPTFVAKVGMEGKTFSESPWFFARSADVYPWAKKRNLDIDDIPALSIDNIEGLQTVLDELAFNRVWTGEEEPTDNYDIWIDPNSTDVTSIETIVNNSVNSALNDALNNGMFTGKSAYQSALDLGFEGTEEEWIASLSAPPLDSGWKFLREIIIPTSPEEGSDGVAYCYAPYVDRLLCAFDTDHNGNPFSCEEFFVFIHGPATVPSGCGDLWNVNIALANSNNPIYEYNIANNKPYHSLGINVGSVHENTDPSNFLGYGHLHVLSKETTYAFGQTGISELKLLMPFDIFSTVDISNENRWESVAIGITTSEEHSHSDGTTSPGHTFGFMPTTTIKVWGR